MLDALRTKDLGACRDRNAAATHSLTNPDSKVWPVVLVACCLDDDGARRCGCAQDEIAPVVGTQRRHMLQWNFEGALRGRDRALLFDIHVQEFLIGRRFHQDNVTALSLGVIGSLI